MVAHRGGSFACPENTQASIQWAFAHGADGVEMDLQQTADGTVVVLHDDSLSRTATSVDAEDAAEFDRLVSTPVAELQFDDIRDIDIGSWKDDRFASERLLSFYDSLHILARSGRNKYFVVEVKGGDFRILPELKRIMHTFSATIHHSQIMWIGFDFALMKEMKKAFPANKCMHVCRVGRQGSDRAPEVEAERQWQRGKKLVDDAKSANLDGIDFEADREAITPEILRYAHYKGLEIGVWVDSKISGSDSPESLLYFALNNILYFTSNMPPTVVDFHKMFHHEDDHDGDNNPKRYRGSTEELQMRAPAIVVDVA